MIKLANGMSYVLGDVVHGYWPRKFIQFSVVLVPTPGEVAPDPDTIEKYGSLHALYFGTHQDPEKSICLSLHGKATSVLRDWILAEWEKYKVDPASPWFNLLPIFDDIAAVGVKP